MASILSICLLVTAQHSEPFRKMGRMHVIGNGMHQYINCMVAKSN